MTNVSGKMRAITRGYVILCCTARIRKGTYVKPDHAFRARLEACLNNLADTHIIASLLGYFEHTLTILCFIAIFAFLSHPCFFTEIYVLHIFA